MADGQVLIEIIAENKQAKQVIRETTHELDNAGKEWEKSGDKFLGLFKKIATSAIVAKVGKALVDLGKKSIEAASDLAEVQNVVDVTFGSASKAIDHWAKDAISQFGLTETQAKQFTSTLGAMMKSSGVAGDDIVKMSTDLAGLAADMASFYNLDFETAFQKIRSGISGETEPLKQLGINMSVANLEAYALTQGITKSFDAMSQGEKTMLRYQYIMQATSDAQGDFARTSDGFANSTRKFESQIDQLETTLGNAFMPTIEKAMNSVSALVGFVTYKPERTVLDDIAEIDIQKETKLAEIEQVKAEVEELVDMLNQLTTNGFDPASIVLGQEEGGQGKTLSEAVEEKKKEVQDAAEGMQGVYDSASGLQDIMDYLGLATYDTNNEQEVWLATCQRLVELLPGLNDIINTETGEIKGGTDAVMEYLDAWAKDTEAAAKIDALAAKIRAIKEAMFTNEGDVATARLRAKAVLKLNSGKSRGLIPEGYLSATDAIVDNMTSEDAMKMAQMIRPGNMMNVISGLVDNDWAKEIGRLNDEERNALADYMETRARLNRDNEIQAEVMKDLREEYAESVKTEEDAKRVLDGYTGSVNDATAAYVELNEESQKTWEDALKGVEDAARAVEEYRTKTVDSVRQSLRSWGGAFDQIQTAREKLANEFSGEELAQQIDIKVSTGEIKSANNMLAALQQRARYLADYGAKMEEAREMGYNADVLATLADGSFESYESLVALVEGGSGYVDSVNSAYDAVQQAQTSLADSLAGYQLDADSQFQDLVQTLTDSMNTLDSMVSTDAPGVAVGGTIDAVLSAIQSRYPSLQGAVSATMAQISLLTDSVYGGVHSLSFGGWHGSPNGFSVAFGVNGSYADGLDYVPFDGFIGQLHRGEAVLTAQEAQVWREFRNGIDANSLAGAIWDNSPDMGGNVYLNGESVGRIMSAAQADSYRQLERSGWRG